MNAAGTLDFVPSQEWQTRRLWSLWDMIKFKLKPFLDTQDVLVTAHATLAKFDEEAVNSGLRASIAAQLEPLATELQGIPEFVMCHTAVRDVIKTLTNYAGRQQILADMHYLRRTLLNQGSVTSLMMLTAAERELYEPATPLFGPEVEAKFADTSEDISEAGKCLGLGRYTAAIFHLMRVMERALRRLGDHLGVALVQDKNWQNVLDEVNKAIKGRDAKAPETKALAEAASHLYAVKLAWRNEVMHPKDTYTQEQAQAIFTNVRTFVSDLAGLL